MTVIKCPIQLLKFDVTIIDICVKQLDSVG